MKNEILFQYNDLFWRLIKPYLKVIYTYQGEHSNYAIIRILSLIFLIKRNVLLYLIKVIYRIMRCGSAPVKQ